MHSRGISRKVKDWEAAGYDLDELSIDMNN